MGELVHAHRAVLAGVARAEGLGGEEAFDVVQEAFAAFFERYVDRPPERARRTLVALTRNLARNRRRLHAHARPHDAGAVDVLAADTSPPEAALIHQETVRQLEACVARLADLQRAVVTLRLLDELPGADVGAQLGISPAHVAVLLHRAKAALASCMAADPCPTPRSLR